MNAITPVRPTPKEGEYHLDHTKTTDGLPEFAAEVSETAPGGGFAEFCRSGWIHAPVKPPAASAAGPVARDAQFG